MITVLCAEVTKLRFHEKRKLNDNSPFSYATINFPRLLGHASFIRSADNALLTLKIAI